MSSNAPVFGLEFDDVDPYPVGVFREKALALGEHNDLGEIPDEMLFGEPVKATGHQPYLNEIMAVSRNLQIGSI
jgi:hypothetical protein